MNAPPRIKRVLLDPNPHLRAPNADVTAPWEELEGSIRQMFKVMHDYRGVGLAAPQVGWNVRLFVMDPDTEEHKPKSRRVYWNPEIVELIGEPTLKNEGCLSLPRVYGDILRYDKVRLKAMSPAGPVDEVFEGYAAQIVQHEVGHLTGRLCIDHWTLPERKVMA